MPLLLSLRESQGESDGEWGGGGMCLGVVSQLTRRSGVPSNKSAGIFC